MELNQAIKRLKQSLVDGDMGITTIKKYAEALASLCGFTGKQTDIDSLSSEDVEIFLHHKAETVSGSTLYNYKGAFEYLFQKILNKPLIINMKLSRNYRPPEHPTTKGAKQTPSVCRIIDIFKPLEGTINLDDALKFLLQEFELRGISVGTQTAYFRAIRKFVNAMCCQDDLNALTISDVKNFIHNQHYVCGVAASACNLYITAIKYLFVLALQKDWNYSAVPYMKLPKRLPTVLSKETVENLINAINDKMYRMIAIVMYSAGLRVSEAISLRISDIRRQTIQIFVSQGKGSKDRYAILSNRCLRELEIYWREFKPSNYLFPSTRINNNFVSKETIQIALRIASQKIGLSETATPHTLRHCFATHLVQDNADVFTVKDAMGHNSLRTTAKYVHLANMSGLNVKSPYDL